MRKIVLLFLLAIVSLQAIIIDEYKVDLYYANGIMMMDSEDEAREDWQARANDLLLNHPELQKHIGKIDVAYNLSDGMVADMWEAFLQKTQLENTYKIGWFAFKRFIGKMPYTRGLRWMIKASEIASKINAEITLREQVDQYKESINSGHGVVVVAHSQGNLFTAKAFKRMGWRKPYFHTIAVASPHHEIPNGGHAISFDNDMITDVPGASQVTVPNPNRRDIVYFPRNALGEINGPRTLERDIKSVQYHGFEYYLGYPTYESILYSGSTGDDAITRTVKMQTSVARVKIEKWLLEEIDHHIKRESQWSPKNLGCTCKEKYAKMTHKFDPDGMNQYLPERVKDFKEGEDGKIYRVDAGDRMVYVRASYGGETIKEVDEGDVCLALLDTADGKLGEISGAKEVPIPQTGAVEVTVTWDNPAIDFDLDVGWSAGEHDVKDTGCAMEHFYIESEYDIYPGTYPVSVTHKKELDDESELVPETMRVMIKVPGKPIKIYKIDVNETDDLEVGHVADIHVKYVDKKPVPEIEPDPKMPDSVIVPNDDGECHVGSWCGFGGGSGGGGGGGGGWGGSGGGGGWGGSNSGGGYSCGDVPCEYKIIPYLKQLLFGPIGGADLKLYRVSDRSLLFEGETTRGDTLYTAGNIEIPDHVIDQLHDETLYMLEAKGGLDIDHDDDMRIDDTPTLNQGTMHLLVTGKQAKEIGFKMNVLTEIAYQVTKDMLATGSTEEIVDKLDEISVRLLKEQIYRDVYKNISYKDVLYWLPTIHQDMLFADYKGLVVPLIENLFADRDIYDQAYKIVYHPIDTVPVLQSKRYDIDEELPAGSLVGDIIVTSEGDSPIEHFTLTGEGNENFVVENNGTIEVAQGATLDYETKTYYRFYVTATTKDGISQPVEILVQLHNVHDSPEMKNYRFGEVFDNTSVGQTVLEIAFDQGTSPLVSAELFGERNEYFEATVHDNNVSIKVAKTLQDFLSHRAYNFELQVSNETQKSKKIPFTIVLRDRRDIPRLANTNLYVDENATAGTVVGKINIISDGDSPITGFKVIPVNRWSFWPTGYFKIDSNGTVMVDKNASLDYEKRREYDTYVVAVNAIGESKKALARIQLNNVPDVPPNCYGNSLTIGPLSRGIIVGTKITLANCYFGDSKLTGVYLEPDSPFEARIEKDQYDSDIVTIRTKSSLSDAKIYDYNLTLTYKNQAGSDTMPVHITIDKDSYTFDMMQGDLNRKLGNVHFGDKTVSYASANNNLFSVDKNGTVIRNSRESYEYKSQYNFKVHVTYEDYTSKEIAVTVNVHSRIISEISIPGHAYKIILNQAKTRAYITNGSGVLIVNIENDHDPKIISTVQTDGDARYMALSRDEHYLYLVDAGKGLKVISIEDENTPQIVGDLSFSEAGWKMGRIALSSDGSKLFFAHSDKVSIINIENKIALSEIGTIPYDGNVKYPFVKDVLLSKDDQYLYFVEYCRGLQVYDISALDTPKLIYSDTLKSLDQCDMFDQIIKDKNESIVSIVGDSGNGAVMKLYLVQMGTITVLRNNLEWDTVGYSYNVWTDKLGYGLWGVYDNYNPLKAKKVMSMRFNNRIREDLKINEVKNIIYSVEYDINKRNSVLSIIDGNVSVQYPSRHEPVISGAEIRIPEENLTSLSVGDIVGKVSILKTGDSPIEKMWIDQAKYFYDYYSSFDCGYTFYAQLIDKNCENDYSYFDVDKDGNIMTGDSDTFKYENVGNMIPFSVYAENENGHVSEQAKVMIKIEESPEMSIKFQKPIIKIDSNVSTGDVVGNVIAKESQRELFLFGMFSGEPTMYCGTGAETVTRYRDWGYDSEMSLIDYINQMCEKVSDFHLESNGDIVVDSIPPEGNYTVHIFAVDRFGMKSLDKLNIEVLP